MDDIPGELPQTLLNNYIEPHKFRQILACRPFVAADEAHIFQSRDRPMNLQVLNRLLLPLVQQMGLVKKNINGRTSERHHEILVNLAELRFRHAKFPADADHLCRAGAKLFDVLDLEQHLCYEPVPRF